MTNVGSPALLGAGRLDGRRAVITGGSRGVGRAIAQALVDAGARVVLVGRDEATLRVAVAQLGEAKNAELGEAKNAELGEAKNAELGEANATFRVTDLGNRSAVQQLADFLVAEDPPIDFLVNNAGLAESAPLGRTSDDL
jgi:gluconate 5-dehydrogenase